MTDDAVPHEIIRALEILGLTLPVTSDALDRAKRVQLYNWNPARYASLTNNPKAYMQSYKTAEEMIELVNASYALLSAVLIPDETAG
ncbi:MAG: hypothetical protein NW202_11030 [Nitrospira sp.]|nr:hypothetical protein [Nitrospira sp.]